MKKIEHVQLFYIKMKEDYQITIFLKILGHFDMIILNY